MSETITRNDLTAILNEVLPPTPSEYKKLLWTNSSPSSGFAAQTISLDLSDYDEVEIECFASAGGADFVTERCLIGKSVMVQFVSGGNGYGNGTPFLTERRFTVSTTGITATIGYGCFTGGNDWSYNSTTRMVPYRIYGIKYERVMPPQVDVGDYVVEQGTETQSGVEWTYRKWNSGVAECWGKKSESMSFERVGSTAFYRATMAGITLPIDLFLSGANPNIETTASSSLWCSGSASATATGTTYVYDVVAGTAAPTVCFYLIGKWK